MRPQRLEMNGFGAFREPTVVDFGDTDLFALVGPTGAGKSTVVDAVTFALYGSIARYDDNRAVAPVINQLSTEARVCLDFEVGGDTYTAVRVVRRTKAGGATTREARLERGVAVLASEARGMTEAVGILFGLDVGQFNRTVVLPQGRFADFLHDDPARRQATVRQLLGLDIYQRIGQEARRRAERTRDQIDMLADNLESLEAAVTVERREEIEIRLARLQEIRKQLVTDRQIVEALQTDERQRTARLEAIADQLTRLAAIETPADVRDLDMQLRTAEERLTSANQALTAARDARAQAIAAVTAGPDLATCTSQLDLVHRARNLTEQRRQTAEELHRASDVLAQARALADEVKARQDALDKAAEAARQLEREAQQAVRSGPDLAQVDKLIDRHERYAHQSADLSEAEDRQRQAAARFDELTRHADDTIEHESAARDRLDAVEHRVGVTGYADLLVVGEPCPLCLQEVHSLPEHDLGDELSEARTSHAEWKKQRDEVERQCTQARLEADSSTATVESIRRLLTPLEQQLVGAPSIESLKSQREDAARLRNDCEAASAAAQDAEEAAAAHRGDPRTRATLKALADAEGTVTKMQAEDETLLKQQQQLDSQLAGVPNEQALEAAIAEATALAKARTEADEAVEAADHERDEATRAVEDLRTSERSAHERLSGARDTVADLSPPSITAATPADGWEQLVGWSTERQAGLRAERESVDSELTDIGERLTVAVAAARQRCADILSIDVDDLDLSVLAEQLVADETHMRSELSEFKRQESELTSLRERVVGLREQAAVADKLGHLMRADQFERWLMESMLTSLADAASGRLHALTGGQFSLHLDHGVFKVCDHGNADEVRLARTLSGGETFLASLALALALAETTAELAPAGAPKIESIFIDEGFGSLDPNALDTVADALEELGASGRMVGIVTHVRDLAERLPVRLEVSRAGGTASIERVEV
jgi:exonuclease SbcC